MVSEITVIVMTAGLHRDSGILQSMPVSVSLLCNPGSCLIEVTSIAKFPLNFLVLQVVKLVCGGRWGSGGGKTAIGDKGVKIDGGGGG